ncbi:hypothetical protein H0H93_011453 [Arthromyces matolae]|nr:hypothetical protein H0H93_011453 [Arthromyces matolae]
MVENAIVNDWIVLYIPRAKKLVDSSTPYEYNLRTRTYLQPSFTLQTLRRLLDANNKKLTSLTTSKKYSFEKREVPINTTLADLINIALKEPPLAPVIMETVMSELNAQTKYPVLFAVDDFQAMYSTSAYRDPHFIPIHSYHLSLPRMILEYASGKRSFAKGVFVGAVTASDTQFPTPLELSAASSVLDNRFVTPYDKQSKVLQKYLKGIMEMRVPDQLSLQEAASLYENITPKGAGGQEACRTLRAARSEKLL